MRLFDKTYSSGKEQRYALFSLCFPLDFDTSRCG